MAALFGKGIWNSLCLAHIALTARPEVACPTDVAD